MPFSDDKNDPGEADEIINAEILVLNQTSKENYIVCHQKTLLPAEIQSKKRPFLPYGSVVNARFLYKKSEGKLIIQNIKHVQSVNKMKMSEKWSQIKLEYSQSLKKPTIICNCLTNGCFTYQNIDLCEYAVFNDVLGIISDRKTLPKQQIGRLICSVVSEEHEGRWKFFIDKIEKFEKVYSLSMSARLLENEYFGLVTREECDEKRDLRLVSSRDFPRDVRIFKSGTHCCHPSEKVAGKSTHDHLKCVQIGVNNVHLLGKSIAMKMKKCHGMGVSSQNNNNNNFANNNNKTDGEEHQEQESSSSSPSILNNSEGQHVNGRSLRENVTQLSVTVHGGFVEIETISEYSGLTDHNGFPLLWSHDVEFVVDFSKIFEGKPYGLYIVKVVRFHRPNVFAKWRLARRAPIVKSLQTKFHSRRTHSVTLAILGDDVPLATTTNSRFGSEVHSCCLPRTDSLDNVELFDALVLNSSGCSTENDNKYEEDESLWKHHADLALKIVEEPSASTPSSSSCK